MASCPSLSPIHNQTQYDHMVRLMNGLASEWGSQVVSEILSAKREINARQAKVLATRFAISPGSFL